MVIIRLFHGGRSLRSQVRSSPCSWTLMMSCFGGGVGDGSLGVGGSIWNVAGLTYGWPPVIVVE